MLLNEKDKNLSMLSKEGWGTHWDDITLTVKYGRMRTLLCTCDISQITVAVHVFPFPNPNKDGGLEASLLCLLYVAYDSEHSSSPLTRNFLVGPAMSSSSFMTINTF